MSKSCEHAVAYVYNYIDHEITWTHKLRIRWHLRKCIDCCGAFAFEERLKEVIAERGRDEPPQELFDTLRTLIERERAGEHDA